MANRYKFSFEVVAENNTEAYNKMYEKMAFDSDISDYKDLFALECLGKAVEEEEMPFLAIGNNELSGKVGKTATCPNCGKQHEVSYGEEVKEDGTKVKSDLLGFVKCKKHSYLVSIRGQLIQKKR